MSLALSSARPASEIGALVRRAAPGGLVAAAEDGFLSAVFAALVVLPLAEIALRATLGVGIQGAASLTQHFTLLVGMLGAAVAARQGRLLEFSAAVFLKGDRAQYAQIFAFACATAATVMLCVASVQFVAAMRSASNTLAYGVPVWIVQLVLPVGFGLIAARLLLHAAANPGGRFIAVALAAALVLGAALVPLEPRHLVMVAVPVLLAGVMLGAPLFAVIGGIALLLLWSTNVPIASVAVDHYSLTANPSLPAIPLFTLAGYFLAESNAPKRLIEVFDAWFGRYRGGAAIATVLACTFFTSFTGASGVTILALGGLAMPLLLASGFRDRAALGLVTGGGLPRVLLFPALPLILYAIVAKTSIKSVFVGGLMPTLLMLGIALWWGVRQRSGGAVERKAFDRARALRALWTAKWELLMPLIPIGALLSGIATPVEAASVTALYAFLVTTVIHRDVRVYPELPRIMAECGLLVGGILLILGVSLALTNFLVDAQIPERAVDWVTRTIQSPWVFLLALNGVLLLAGCLMDTYCAIVVLTPLIVPMGLAFGIHPVHLGMIFLANMELGFLTPPIGINLFFSSYRFDRSLPEVCRSVAPLFLALAAGVTVITYVPWLSTGMLSLVR